MERRRWRRWERRWVVARVAEREERVREARREERRRRRRRKEERRRRREAARALSLADFFRRELLRRAARADLVRATEYRSLAAALHCLFSSPALLFLTRAAKQNAFDREDQ